MKKKLLFLSAILVLVVGTNRTFRHDFAKIEAELIDFPHHQFEYSTQSSKQIASLPDNHKIPCLLGEKINLFYKSQPFLQTWCSEKIFLAEFEKDKLLVAFKSLEGEQPVHETEAKVVFNKAISMELKSGSAHLCWEKISANLALESVGELTVVSMSDVIGHGRDIQMPTNCEHYNVECKDLKIRKALTKKNNHYTSIMARTVDISNEAPYACLIRLNNEIHGYKIISPDNLCHYSENQVYADNNYELLDGVVYDVSIDIVSKGYMINLYERHYEIAPIDLSLITSLPRSTIALKNKNFSCLYQMKLDHN
jgi:hypothetical protein